MNEEQKRVIRTVIEAWEKANTGRSDGSHEYDELIYEAFCNAGDIEPLRKLLLESK